MYTPIQAQNGHNLSSPNAILQIKTLKYPEKGIPIAQAS